VARVRVQFPDFVLASTRGIQHSKTSRKVTCKGTLDPGEGPLESLEGTLERPSVEGDPRDPEVCPFAGGLDHHSEAEFP
jgi:hypothetical protein